MSIIYINSYQFAAAPPSGYDPDAAAYIARVEGASGDNQALETATKDAINAFVLGCKADGIWNAIKASCILSGARTLAGALQPLVGTAPTNIGPFTSEYYDRKTGLQGNGTTFYLDSNRNNNADPQNNRHLSVWVHTPATFTEFAGDIGFYNAGPGSSYIGRAAASANLASSSALVITGVSNVTGFRGVSRSLSSGFNYRASSSTSNITSTSGAPGSGNVLVFNGGISLHSNARLAFYSIGEALDLALLDARVTTLINAFAATIP